MSSLWPQKLIVITMTDWLLSHLTGQPSVHNPRGMQVLGSIPNKGTVFSKCFLAEAESPTLSKTLCLDSVFQDMVFARISCGSNMLIDSSNT